MRTPIRAALAAAKKPVAVTAIAVTAFGIAGTGTAVANGMIGSADIRNQSIRSVDIGANQVGSSELRPDSVRKEHVADNSVGWRELNDYARAQASADSSSSYNTEGPTVPVDSGFQTLTVECPNDGAVALSGGLKFDSGAGSAADVDLQASYPSDLTQAADGSWHATSWTVAFDSAADGVAVQPFAVCVTN